MKNQIVAGFLVVMLHCAAFAQTTEQKALVINGQVLDDQGLPVAGVVVTAYPDAGLRGKLPTGSSDARGEFTIAVSRTGLYTMTASKPTDGYPSTASPFYHSSEEPLAHVDVEADKPAPFANLRLGPKAGKLTGSIVDAETRRPVESAALIRLCRTEAPKYCYRVSTGFQLNILAPSGPFTIQISVSGYQDWDGSEDAVGPPASLQVAPGATKSLKVSLQKAPSDSVASDPVLAAPQPVSPIPGAELDHFPRKTRLEWSTVPGAASYSVELEACDLTEADGKDCERSAFLQLRGNPPLSGIEGTSYEFLFIGAQPGRWRVWAVDAKGRAGAKSAWSIFRFKQ